MCSLCLRTPCAPSCPNAEEPRPVYICSICDKGILVGDKVFIAPQDGPICESCVEDMTGKEMMMLLGERMDTVEEKF